jgi:metal-responsive CopG/Arc/MetJ family transcriptional regulator
MRERIKPRIVVDDEQEIVDQLDAIAAAEGISRSDVVRRALRLLLFSSGRVPTDENAPADAAIAAN